MGFIEEHKLSLTTNGSGAASGSTSVIQNGTIKGFSIDYDAATAGCVTAFSVNGVTPLSITGNTDIFGNMSQQVLNSSGTAVTNAHSDVVIANSAISVSMTGGGATKTHSIVIYVERGN